MTFAVHDIRDFEAQLLSSVYDRRFHKTIPPEAEVVRYPALLVWLRDDIDNAQRLVSAYGYWNLESQHYIDIGFCGWAFDGMRAPTIAQEEQSDYHPAEFNVDRYHHCQNQIRQNSSWEPSGDIDFLLLDYLCEPSLHEGKLDFSRAIPLPVSRMLANGWIPSVNSLLQDLIIQARRAYERSPDKDEWEVANRFATTKGGWAIWRWVSKTFLKDAGAMYEQLNTYSYRNMARMAIAEA